MKIESLCEQHYLGNVVYQKPYVVYTKANVNASKQGYDYNLYVYNELTNEHMQLTTSSMDKSFVFLDEQTILFTSSRDNKEGTTYYQISLHGGEAKKAFHIPSRVSKIVPLNQHDFLIVALNDCTYEDYLMSNQRDIIDQAKKENEDYEIIDELPYVFNGRGFINKLRRSLYIYHLDSDAYTKLSPRFMDVMDFIVEGSIVYFFGDEYQVKNEQVSTLYQYDLDKDERTCLLEPGLRIGHIAMLAGKLVIHGHDTKKYKYSRNLEFFVLEEGNLKFLADYDLSCGSTVGSDCRLVGGRSFKADNQKIYTTMTVWAGSDVYSIDNMGNRERITDFGGSIDCFDIHDNQLYFVGMKEGHLQELYHYDINHNTYTRLTHFNEAYENEHPYLAPQSIRYSYEGNDYEGWVIYPEDYNPSRKYPAILEIHGGPKVVYGDIYNFEMQLFASEGYFVFFTNPRGSDGRGNAFADLYGKLGTIDYDDLMAFTDKVIEQVPQIDVNRIGVTGGSYGGYMTNWIIGHTNRFRCAVSQRSISNYVSKSLTTDIGYYHNMAQTMATPWDHVERMWFHSPLQYANQCTTPTLFIQSDEDYRCYQADAFQMYQALVLNGCTARMCLFHHENHELSRSGKPIHRIKRLEEMLHWFDIYLKGVRA